MRDPLLNSRKHFPHPVSMRRIGVIRVIEKETGSAFLWILVGVCALLVLTAGGAFFLSSSPPADAPVSKPSPQASRFKIEVPPEPEPEPAAMPTTPVSPEPLPAAPAGAAGEGEPAAAVATVPEKSVSGKKVGAPTPSAEETKPLPLPVSPPAVEAPAQPTADTREEKAPEPALQQPETGGGDLKPGLTATASMDKPGEKTDDSLPKPAAPAETPPPLETRPPVDTMATPPASQPPLIDAPAPIPGKTVEPEKHPEAEAPSVSTTDAPAKEPGPSQRLTVSVLSGNVRERPGTDAPVVFRLMQGDTVTVLETASGWHRIEDDGKRTGWAHRRLFGRETRKIAAAQPASLISRIDISPGIMGGDVVLFELTEDRPPETMVIEGSQPRIVCDFPNTRLGPELGHEIEGKGEAVQKIRSGIHGPPKPRVRLVLDLSPLANYTVRQVYDKAERRYVLHIEQKKEAAAPPAE